MILINKNSTNNIILSLSEKTTLTNAVYLFEVINDQTQVSKCFIADDISTNKESFNEFDLIENSTEDLLNGTFELIETGFYKFNIYEQSSTTNLDPTLATNLIEKGKLLCVGTETTTPEFTGTQTDYTVYGG